MRKSNWEFKMTVEEKYALYEKILIKWNGKMNLVAKSTLGEIRKRHIDDSVQLAKFIQKNKTIIDLGSGAGFPAVVLAILGYNVIAIESIAKKCKFLEEVKSKLNIPNLKIVNDRVENVTRGLWPVIRSTNYGTKISKNHKKKKYESRVKSKNYVFTARAFAPLIRIFEITQKLDIPYILLKGQGAPAEIAVAQRKYSFKADLYPSDTGNGFIIKLTIM